MLGLQHCSLSFCHYFFMAWIWSSLGVGCLLPKALLCFPKVGVLRSCMLICCDPDNVGNLVSPAPGILKAFLPFLLLLPHPDIPLHSPFTPILVFPHLMSLQISTTRFVPAAWKRYFRATSLSEKALRAAGGFRIIWTGLRVFPRSKEILGKKVCLCT